MKKEITEISAAQLLRHLGGVDSFPSAFYTNMYNAKLLFFVLCPNYQSRRDLLQFSFKGQTVDFPTIHKYLVLTI